VTDILIDGRAAIDFARLLTFSILSDGLVQENSKLV
jgi:hypothetical protein